MDPVELNKAASLLSLDTLKEWGGLAAPYALKGLFALLILWIGFKVARWLGGLAQKNAVKAPNVDETLAKFLGSLVRYAIMAMVVIAAIGQVGVQTASRPRHWFGPARHAF